MVFVIVVGLSVWQVAGLWKKREMDPEVLAAITSLSLEDRVAALEARVAVLERNTGLVKPRSTGKRSEKIVNLNGGKIISSEWAKITGTDFSLDASLYGNSVEISWEGWIDNGNGAVRLYDSTNHRVVDSSEISVESGVKSSFYSKPLSIWRGQNEYYIEGKNPGGELVLTSPRLKIVIRQ